MANLHYPVLTWSDAAGVTTAALVGEFETAAACGGSEAEALRQLKELVEWRLVHEPWNAEADLAEASLLEVKVEVRPQYATRRRLMPCPDTVWLRVPCVTGRQESGLRLCVVPHLSIQFNYQDAAGLLSLVAHYVKDYLQRSSPSQLAACLPPRGCRLTEVVVREPGGRTGRLSPSESPELRLLFAVADPLPESVGRRRTVSAAYGREALAEGLAGLLGREGANVILVGESGVGKSTLLLEAIKRWARQSRRQPSDPEGAEEDVDLGKYRFWRTSGGRLIAGMRYLGEWEARCEKVMAQLANRQGVLCAESLLELLQVGGEGPGSSVAAFLLPYLQRGELRMVAEATPDEMEACRRLLPGLLDEFRVVRVEALDDGGAMQVLERVATAHAAAVRVEFEPGAVPLVFRLFRRFQPYAAFPGPAAAFIRTLCEARRASGPQETAQVTADEVVRLFVRQSGLPELLLRDEVPLALGDVRAALARRIIGQREAVDAAVRLVATIKAGLSDPARPLGVLFFCGPSGVGKTALAKALAGFCFGARGEEDRLVRLDMSEYAGWGAAPRLLQSSQGGPAPWIERVRRQPFCVVLLDEIEKAAPDVFDALLGLLDEGRLTDRFGRVTWFRSAIVVITSNLGAGFAGPAGFGPEAPPAYAAEVARFFRPEFFNRLDAVLTFQPLGQAEICAIARKELEDLAAREGLVAEGIRVRWTDRLVEVLVREGYDHRLGVRPLQRAMERLVAVPLARWRAGRGRVREVDLLVDIDEQGRTTVTSHEEQ